MSLNYLFLIRLIFMLSFWQTVVIAQGKYTTQTLNLMLPDCDTVKTLNIQFKEALLDENRFQYLESKDTLNFIYCYAEKTNHAELKANTLAKLAAYTINNENDDDVFERFISIVNMSIEISEKNNFIIPLAHAYDLLCSNFTTNRLYDLATLYANRFIGMAKEAGDSVLIAEAHMHLGRILREEKNYSESDSILNLSLTYLTGSGSSNRIGAWTFLHLANLKRREEKFMEAIAFAKRGISLAQKSCGNSNFQIAALSTEIILSNVELGIFENEEGLKKLKYSTQSKWIKGHYNYTLGIMHEKNGQKSKAINNYLDALRLCYDAGVYQSVLDISRRLLPMLSKHEISPRVLEIYQISQNATQKLIQQNGSNNLLKAAFFKLEHEQYERNLLQQELVNSRKISLFSICLILLFLVIMTLIIQQNEKARKLNASINKLNVDLIEKNEKLEESQNNLQEMNKKLNLILEQREKVIQRLQKFASILAHDFKEPVRTIVSFGKLLNKTITDKISDSENEFFGFMISSTERLNLMVDRLYKYSNNTLALMNQFQVIDLNIILQDVRNDLLLKINEKNGKLIIEPCSHRISGDKILIYQLFQNLISNALKYSKDEEPPVITVTSRVEDTYLIVSIADNGIGIKETPELDIFALFSRTHEVSEKDGHGLGLATCKEVVEIHGGKIDYSSEFGIGTTFNIWFKDFQIKSA